MRLIKMLGLAAVAAVAAMAFIGASSASANTTALCKIDAAICSEGELIKHVHETSPEGILKTETPSLTIKCVVLYLGDVLSPWLANPLVIHGNFTYTSCKPLGCEAKEVSTSSLINVLREGTELAKVTGTGEVLVICGEILHCVYNGNGLIGHGLGPLGGGGTNGNVSITEQPTTKVSGTLCPKAAKLTLTTTPLEPTYISS